jgi:hypothetical protein
MAGATQERRPLAVGSPRALDACGEKKNPQDNHNTRAYTPCWDSWRLWGVLEEAHHVS